MAPKGVSAGLGSGLPGGGVPGPGVPGDVVGEGGVAGSCDCVPLGGTGTTKTLPELALPPSASNTSWSDCGDSVTVEGFAPRRPTLTLCSAGGGTHSGRECGQTPSTSVKTNSSDPSGADLTTGTRAVTPI